MIKLKVGDRVVVRRDLRSNERYGGVYTDIIGKMAGYAGKVITVDDIYEGNSMFYNKETGKYWTVGMLEGLIWSSRLIKVGDEVVTTDDVPDGRDFDGVFCTGSMCERKGKKYVVDAVHHRSNNGMFKLSDSYNYPGRLLTAAIYKGDLVRVKDELEAGKQYCGVGTNSAGEMSEHCGEIMLVESGSFGSPGVTFYAEGNGWYWSATMVEKVIPRKELTINGEDVSDVAKELQEVKAELAETKSKLETAKAELGRARRRIDTLTEALENIEDIIDEVEE